MKQDLRALNRELKLLVRKTETLMKAVERLEKSQAAKARPKRNNSDPIYRRYTLSFAAPSQPGNSGQSDLTDINCGLRDRIYAHKDLLSSDFWYPGLQLHGASFFLHEKMGNQSYQNDH